MLTANTLLEGRFLVTASMERGGMATVFKGFDTLQSPPVPVAIKCYINTSIEHKFLQEAFHRETDALKSLDHPNIVRHFSSGLDDQNIPYIVMEWLPIAMPDWINGSRESMETWDDFYFNFIRPLVKAVAYSCANKIAHRDLKPSNLRFDARNQMRIIDFGICIHEAITASNENTLGGFKSQKFAPPNPVWLEDPFRRDVYGVAALCTHAMIEWQQAGNQVSLSNALDKLTMPDEFRQLLATIIRCDEEAPIDPEDMLRQLESLQGKRTATKLENFVGLTFIEKIAWTTVQEGFTPEAIRKDLNGHAFIAFHNSQERRADGALKLYGEEFEYSVKLDTHDSSRLFVIGVRRPKELAVFQNSKDRAFPLYARFTFKAFPPTQAVDLEGILEEMREKELEDERKRQEREERRLEDALFEIVASKQKLIFSIGRMDFTKTEKANIITIPKLKEVKVDVQNLVVKLFSSGGKFLYKGRVSPTDDGYRFTTDYVDNLILPGYGSLEIDKDYERKVIESQKETLKLVFSNSACNPRMGDLLKHPEGIQYKDMAGTITFHNPKLDQDKQAILQKFLAAEEVCLVEGPPGTGKTDLIVEAIQQQIDYKADSRILVVSQTNVALDNIIERIPPSLDIVRIGDERNDKISRFAKPFLVSACLDDWGEALNSKCEQFVIDWASSNGVDPSEIKLCSLLWRYISEIEDFEKERGSYNEAQQQLTERPFDDESIRLEREQKQ